jgi:hypothetical protein
MDEEFYTALLTNEQSHINALWKENTTYTMPRAPYKQERKGHQLE